MALGGSLPALTQYAVGNAFRVRDTLQVLPQLQVYRQEAEYLALQAAERGSLQAIIALAGAYSPSRDVGDQTYLAQVVSADPGKALALYLRARAALTAQGATKIQPLRLTFIGHSIETLRRQMDPAQIARAETQAERWRQQWADPVDVATVGSSPERLVLDQLPEACGS